MLREEYLEIAASVHIEGARWLRDGAAALLPCCTLFSCKTAFSLSRALTQGENLMDEAVALSGGLLHMGVLTKYTPVIEARMRLAGADLDAGITSRQQAAERVRTVPPGTRADVYEGFIALSRKAAVCAEELSSTLDDMVGAIKEGGVYLAVPLGAYEFLRKICADYAAASVRLAAGEDACLVRRADVYSAYKKCLMHAAAAQGVDNPNASADTLAALAAGGLIPGVPAVLFDLLLRYENLPRALGAEKN